MSTKVFNAIIFDMDGTLLNSLGDITNSMNEVLTSKGLRTFNLEEYKYLIGRGPYELVKNVLSKCNQTYPEGDIIEMYDSYLYKYAQRQNFQSKPYAGILELLQQLKHLGILMGVISNKPQIQINTIIDQFFPDFFSIFYGSAEITPLKPDPHGAIKIAHNWRLSVDKVVLLGDSEIDMKTAENAGMYGVGALWGFREANELLNAGAKRLVSQPIDMISMFE